MHVQRALVESNPADRASDQEPPGPQWTSPSTPRTMTWQHNRYYKMSCGTEIVCFAINSRLNTRPSTTAAATPRTIVVDLMNVLQLSANRLWALCLVRDFPAFPLYTARRITSNSTIHHRIYTDNTDHVCLQNIDSFTSNLSSQFLIPSFLKFVLWLQRVIHSSKSFTQIFSF